MVSQQTMDRVAMIGVLFIGFALFVISILAFNSVKPECDSAFIRDSWTAILVISACSIAAAFMYLTCTHKGNCYDAHFTVAVRRTSMFYFLILIAFSITIIVLTSMMLEEFKKMKNTPQYDLCGGDTNVRQVWFMMALAILTLLISGIFLWRTWRVTAEGVDDEHTEEELEMT